jgi:hypothetical protein
MWSRARRKCGSRSTATARVVALPLTPPAYDEPSPASGGAASLYR